MSALVPNPRDESDNPYPEHIIGGGWFPEVQPERQSAQLIEHTVDFDPGSVTLGFSDVSFAASGGHHNYMVTSAGLEEQGILGVAAGERNISPRDLLRLLVLLFVDDHEPTAMMVAGSFAELKGDARYGKQALDILYQLEKQGLVV